MKICAIHSAYHPVFSGAAIQFHEMAQQFISHGCHVSVITIQFPGLPAQENINGVRVIRLPIVLGSKRLRKISFMLISVFWLMKIRKEFEILHLHGYDKNFALTVWIAKILGKKVIYQLTLMTDSVVKQRGFLYKAGMRYLDEIIALSTPLLDQGREGPYPNKVRTVLGYGVDTKTFLPPTRKEKKNVRDMLNLDLETYYICLVGSILRRKGIDIMVKAFASVYKSYPNISLLLVGEDGSSPLNRNDPGKQKLYITDEIKSLIRSFGIEERVIFTGFTDKVAAYMQASDMFVFPSRKEGLGAVILQAMATGLPCVVSELDGISEGMITNEVDGFIISGSDPEGYAKIMRMLLSEKDRAKEIGLNARNTIEKRFELADISGRYLRYYKHILEG